MQFSEYKAELSSAIQHKDVNRLYQLISTVQTHENRFRELFSQARESWVVPELEDDPYKSLIPAFDTLENNPIIMTPMDKFANDTKTLLFQDAPYSKLLSSTGHVSVNRETFNRNFNDIFCEGMLRHLNWDHVFAAGGSVLAGLVPIPASHNRNNRQRRKYFHDIEFPSSDIDLFIWGLSEEYAKLKLVEIHNAIADACPYDLICVRSVYSISFVSQYPFRHVQVVLRLYSSPLEILSGFDVDSCSVGYDGRDVYMTPRAHLSLLRKINSIDMTRRSPTYEMRLSKYASRGFRVEIPHITKRLVDPQIYEKSWNQVNGLGRLLVLEKLRTPEERTRYKEAQRAIHAVRGSQAKIQYQMASDVWVRARTEDLAGGGAEASDYSIVFLPWGPAWSSMKIQGLLTTKDRLFNDPWSNGFRQYPLHPCLCGEITKVIGDAYDFEAPPDASIADPDFVKHFVRGPLSWLKDNPGRQMVGSFNPITEGDWMEGALLSADSHVFMSAVARNDVAKMREILSQKTADQVAGKANERDDLGRTPLIMAVLCNSIDAVRLLLSPEVDSDPSFRLPDGRSALHLAAEYNRIDILRLVVNRAKDKYGSAPLETKMEEDVVIVDDEEEEDEKPSRKAKAKAKPKAASRRMKDEDDEDDDEDDDGGDEDEDDEGHHKKGVVESKEEEPKSYNAPPTSVEEFLNRKDFSNGMTPLHWAMAVGNCDAADVLVSLGANATLSATPQDNQEEEQVGFGRKAQTPTPAAVSRLSIHPLLIPCHTVNFRDDSARRFVQLLFLHGASSIWMDSSGRTIFHILSGSGHHEYLKILLEEDPLLKAARETSSKKKKMSDEDGNAASIILNAVDFQGYSALSRSIETNHLECARELLRHGCKPMISQEMFDAMVARRSSSGFSSSVNQYSAISQPIRLLMSFSIDERQLSAGLYQLYTNRNTKAATIRSMLTVLTDEGIRHINKQKIENHASTVDIEDEEEADAAPDYSNNILEQFKSAFRDAESTTQDQLLDSVVDKKAFEQIITEITRLCVEQDEKWEKAKGVIQLMVQNGLQVDDKYLFPGVATGDTASSGFGGYRGGGRKGKPAAASTAVSGESLMDRLIAVRQRMLTILSFYEHVRDKQQDSIVVGLDGKGQLLIASNELALTPDQQSVNENEPCLMIAGSEAEIDASAVCLESKLRRVLEASRNCWHAAASDASYAGFIQRSVVEEMCGIVRHNLRLLLARRRNQKKLMKMLIKAKQTLATAGGSTSPSTMEQIMWTIESCGEIPFANDKIVDALKKMGVSKNATAALLHSQQHERLNPSVVRITPATRYACGVVLRRIEEIIAIAAPHSSVAESLTMGPLTKTLPFSSEFISFADAKKTPVRMARSRKPKGTDISVTDDSLLLSSWLNQLPWKGLTFIDTYPKELETASSHSYYHRNFNENVVSISAELVPLYQQLFEACWTGNHALVEQLACRDKVVLTVSNVFGHNPFNIALLSSRKDIAEAVISFACKQHANYRKTHADETLIGKKLAARSDVNKIAKHLGIASTDQMLSRVDNMKLAGSILIRSSGYYDEDDDDVEDRVPMMFSGVASAIATSKGKAPDLLAEINRKKEKPGVEGKMTEADSRRQLTANIQARSPPDVLLVAHFLIPSRMVVESLTGVIIASDVLRGDGRSNVPLISSSEMIALSPWCAHVRQTMRYLQSGNCPDLNMTTVAIEGDKFTPENVEVKSNQASRKSPFRQKKSSATATTAHTHSLTRLSPEEEEFALLSAGSSDFPGTPELLLPYSIIPRSSKSSDNVLRVSGKVPGMTTSKSAEDYGYDEPDDGDDEEDDDDDGADEESVLSIFMLKRKKAKPVALGSSGVRRVMIKACRQFRNELKSSRDIEVKVLEKLDAIAESDDFGFYKNQSGSTAPSLTSWFIFCNSSTFCSVLRRPDLLLQVFQSGRSIHQKNLGRDWSIADGTSMNAGASFGEEEPSKDDFQKLESLEPVMLRESAANSFVESLVSGKRKYDNHTTDNTLTTAIQFESIECIQVLLAEIGGGFDYLNAVVLAASVYGLHPWNPCDESTNDAHERAVSRLVNDNDFYRRQDTAETGAKRKMDPEPSSSKQLAVETASGQAKASEKTEAAGRATENRIRELIEMTIPTHKWGDLFELRRNCPFELAVSMGAFKVTGWLHTSAASDALATFVRDHEIDSRQARAIVRLNELCALHIEESTQWMSLLSHFGLVHKPSLERLEAFVSEYNSSKLSSKKSFFVGKGVLQDWFQSNIISVSNTACSDNSILDHCLTNFVEDADILAFYKSLAGDAVWDASVNHCSNAVSASCESTIPVALASFLQLFTKPLFGAFANWFESVNKTMSIASLESVLLQVEENVDSLDDVDDDEVKQREEKNKFRKRNVLCMREWWRVMEGHLQVVKEALGSKVFLPPSLTCCGILPFEWCHTRLTCMLNLSVCPFVSTTGDVNSSTDYGVNVRNGWYSLLGAPVKCLESIVDKTEEDEEEEEAVPTFVSMKFAPEESDAADLFGEKSEAFTFIKVLDGMNFVSMSSNSRIRDHQVAIDPKSEREKLAAYDFLEELRRRKERMAAKRPELMTLLQSNLSSRNSNDNSMKVVDLRDIRDGGVVAGVLESCVRRRIAEFQAMDASVDGQPIAKSKRGSKAVCQGDVLYAFMKDYPDVVLNRLAFLRTSAPLMVLFSKSNSLFRGMFGLFFDMYHLKYPTTTIFHSMLQCGNVVGIQNVIDLVAQFGPELKPAFDMQSVLLKQDLEMNTILHVALGAGDNYGISKLEELVEILLSKKRDVGDVLQTLFFSENGLGLTVMDGAKRSLASSSLNSCLAQNFAKLPEAVNTRRSHAWGYSGRLAPDNGVTLNPTIQLTLQTVDFLKDSNHAEKIRLMWLLNKRKEAIKKTKEQTLHSDIKLVDRLAVSLNASPYSRIISDKAALRERLLSLSAGKSVATGSSALGSLDGFSVVDVAINSGNPKHSLSWLTSFLSSLPVTLNAKSVQPIPVKLSL